MRDIKQIRGALSKIDRARFEISDRPPVLRPQVSARRTTSVYENNRPLVGIDVDLEGESARSKVDRRALEDELYGPLDRAVVTAGVDALAWYVSFHNSRPDWGIYIPLTSLHYLADRLYKGTRIANSRRRQIALELLLQHEQFHFAADYAQTQFELILQEPCRALLMGQLKHGQYLEIEEAIANAHALRALGCHLSEQQLQPIRDFTVRQPPGYRDALPYVDDEGRFRLGLDEVVKSYAALPALEKLGSLPISLIEWASFFGNLDDVDSSQCPVHFLHDDDWFPTPLTPRLLNSLPDIRETRRFLKRLARLSASLQVAWHDTKRALGSRPPDPKQFEKLRGKFAGLFSVRIGSGHRVHLRPASGFAYWDAIDVGTHTEMGHD